MARKGRVEFAGAVYHVLDRGDRREDIFRGDEDRELFLQTLAEACARTGWRLHAWVLMSNHNDSRAARSLALRARLRRVRLDRPRGLGSLVAGETGGELGGWNEVVCARVATALSRQASAQTTYTVRFNRRHRVSGHLFQGRYKAVVVDPEERGYFATLSDYIHLNPVRAKLVGLEDRLYDYLLSSYRWYAATQGRAAWFEPSWVLGELGLRDDASGRRAYAERMRRRAVEERADLGKSPTREDLRRGWCLGGAAFRERMLGLLDAGREKLGQGKEVDSLVRRSHGEDEARRLFWEGLFALGLEPEQLADLPKGDVRKLALAAFIGERTIVSNAWLAQNLHLGHVSRISRCWSEGGDGNPWRKRLEAIR